MVLQTRVDMYTHIHYSRQESVSSYHLIIYCTIKIINYKNDQLTLSHPRIELFTGCSITPWSAISQASCRSPDDRRGAALLQKDVGGHVGVNHTQKVFRKCGNGNHSGQTPSGSGAPLRGFSRRRFCGAVWGRWRVLFFKEKSCQMV